MTSCVRCGAFEPGLAGRTDRALGLTPERLRDAAGPGAVARRVAHRGEVLFLGATERGLLLFGPRLRAALPWSEAKVGGAPPFPWRIRLAGRADGSEHVVYPFDLLTAFLPTIGARRLRRELEAIDPRRWGG